MSEVKRYYAEAVSEHVLGAFVSSKDYDALAAQRDEGLAREAELKKELAQFQNGYTEQWQSREALQQRLAEAEKLMTSAIQHWAAAEPGYMSRMMSACMPKLREFLAHPGGADVHKAPAQAVKLPRRKVKTEYSTADEDAQVDAWNAALDAVQEMNR